MQNKWSQNIQHLSSDNFARSYIPVIPKTQGTSIDISQLLIAFELKFWSLATTTCYYLR